MTNAARLSVGLVIAILAFPGTGRAQSTETFDSLAAKLRDAQVIEVVDLRGRRTTGTVLPVSASSGLIGTVAAAGVGALLAALPAGAESLRIPAGQPVPRLEGSVVAEPEYLILDTARTGDMQKQLQDAADRGYRLVSGQGSWLLSAILEKTTAAEPIDYLLLSTKRSGTMQKELDTASTQGYRFASVLGVGKEVIIAMQRRKGTTTRTHQQVVLATSGIKTMERELLAEVAKGFRFVGQTVFDGLISAEYVAILERPILK